MDAPTPVFTLLLDQEMHAESSLAGVCVDPPLPTDAEGVPDCVVLVARSRAADTSPVACATCPGADTRAPAAATLARASLPEGEGSGCYCELSPHEVAGATDLHPTYESGWWYGAPRKECPETAHGFLGFAASATLGPGPITFSVACYPR